MNTNEYFEKRLKSGLYVITCIPTNKHYVGYSTHVVRRLNAHKSHLRRQCDSCKELQKDYDKYGIKHFHFQKLQIGLGLSASELEILETTVLLTLSAEQRYNLYTNWRKRPSEKNPFYGKTHTKETRLTMSQALKGKPSGFLGHQQTNSVKQFLSQQNSGTSSKEKRKPLMIDGQYYESISEASEKTGLGRRLIRERCHSTSERFANYQWVIKKNL